MNFFDPDQDDEPLDEILSDVKDLYNEIINGEPSEVQKCCTAYSQNYRRILKKLMNCLENPINDAPGYLYELTQEFDPERTLYLKKENEIKIIEFGLKRIMKKNNIQIPERKGALVRENTPSSPIIVNANQTMSNEINIEVKIEVNQAVDEFVKEINKDNPNPTKLKKLLEIIKKGTGYGSIRIIEALLEKLFGLGI